MKRIALAAAAALLGTGCISSTTTTQPPCLPTISVSWSFQLYDGSPPTGCGGAGVSWVDVFVDGSFVQSYACTAGGATIGVASGTHSVLLEGIDANNRIAYRDSLSSVPTNGCGDRLVLMTPAEGSVNLNYSVSALPSVCNSSPCYLWYSVWDDVANASAAVVNGQSSAPVKVLYQYPADVQLRLPVGSFTLDWMELVGPDPTFAGLLITCANPAATFDVGSAALTTVPAALACTPP